ncbi:MFS sugar transporter, partial [Penicillium lividum]
KDGEIVDPVEGFSDKTDDPISYEHKEKRIGHQDLEGRGPNNLNAVFQTPLAGIPLTQLRDLDEVEREALIREHTQKWHQAWQLYWLAIMCSLAAAVQGMDETVNNGAQAFYLKRFGIENSDNLTGLVVGAPYLACAILGCWLTEPLNRYFARRGTIFISCLIAAIASIWEGVANSWVNLFIARFVLGLGIGSKSTAVPIYAAECSLAPIRGALVMMWQMWTAFGIMLGNIMGVAFMSVGNDLNWRLMLGSTVFLPLIVCAQVYVCPESPRWLIQHGKINKAYVNFKILRPTELQAARDLYYAYVGVELEREINKGKNFFSMFLELFTVPRNRRATLASWIVMFMQQFCGVNVIAYYSTTIFEDSGYSTSSALLASMGTGILNWVFALPAVFTIDTWGRRNLLLFTFPFLAIFLFWAGFSFWIDANDGHKRIAMVTTGMYLFEVFYSPGEGPVPFTYSAEAFPLHVREPQGAFGWYAGWCVIGWFLVLLFVPETKALTLEELDQVFSVSTRKHAAYQIRNCAWHFRVWILRQKLEPLPKFYQGAEHLAEVGDAASK